MSKFQALNGEDVDPIPETRVDRSLHSWWFLPVIMDIGESIVIRGMPVNYRPLSMRNGCYIDLIGLEPELHLMIGIATQDGHKIYEIVGIEQDEAPLGYLPKQIRSLHVRLVAE